MSKIRLDSYLVEEGYFPSREQAKTHIMAKKVLINDEPIIKPGQMVDPSKIKAVRIKEKSKYVSRAGYKLEGAIRTFGLDFRDKIVLDVGSSTGGFCDCALKHGAKSVCALDVGTNQLVFSLRNHPQITVMEQTNFRTVTKDDFKSEFDIITMDVSFISATLLVDNVYLNLKSNGKFILLIKPQFEAGRDVKRNKNGVIMDEKVNEAVKNEVVDFIKQRGFTCEGVTKSPIKGSKGNQEYLAVFTKN